MSCGIFVLWSWIGFRWSQSSCLDGNWKRRIRVMSMWRWGRNTTQKPWIATRGRLIKKLRIRSIILYAMRIGHTFICFWETIDADTKMQKKQSDSMTKTSRSIYVHQTSFTNGFSVPLSRFTSPNASLQKLTSLEINYLGTKVESYDWIQPGFTAVVLKYWEPAIQLLSHSLWKRA